MVVTNFAGKMILNYDDIYYIILANEVHRKDFGKCFGLGLGLSVDDWGRDMIGLLSRIGARASWDMGNKSLDKIMVSQAISKQIFGIRNRLKIFQKYYI